MDICILGSGISGLAAAHYLSAQPGLSLTVLEGSHELGGRANVDTDGEHCPRFFLEDYAYLLQLLREVPFGDGSLHDTLRPARRFALTTASEWVEINHLYASMSRELSIRDKRAISKANRASLLVAKQGQATSNKFGSTSNYSARALVSTVGNLWGSKGSYVLPGDTARYLTNPWVEHLRSRGVKFEHDCWVDRLRIDGDEVEATAGGSCRRFDAMLVTAFAHDAYSLLDRSGVERPLDCRQHTHCKCFTVDLDPRELILRDATPRVYSNAGFTTVVQPDEHRCVTLSTVSESTELPFVLDRLRRDLKLEHKPLRVRTRDNLAPGEAVFIGDYVDPVALGAPLAPRVYFAGSYTDNSYPVDSGEAAARSAYHAVERMAADHHGIEMRWPEAPVELPAPASRRPPAASAAAAAHPNSPRSPRASRFLWGLACRISALTGKPVARISFSDQSQTPWPLSQPAIYVANHRSIFDVVAGLLTFTRLGVQPRLVVAERFFEGPLGKALYAVGALPALRGSDATINAAVAAVRAGDSVAFMVEGKLTTRAEAAAAGHGRGASTVSVLTGSPVVPIGSWGTDRPWPAPRPWPLVRIRRPRVGIAIGEPLQPGADSPSRLGERIRASIDQLETAARDS